MSFTDAVRSCFSQYAGFSGRARRSEYWFFTLAYLLIYVAAFVVFGGIGSATGKPAITALAALVVLALVVPMLAVTVRRLHDTGRSGWWWFISLVPFVGGIVLLVFAVQESTPGPNAFGPSPKEVPAVGNAATAPVVGY